MRQELQIFINGQEVDIHPDTDPALTYQINNLATAANVNSNITNIFALANTLRNRAILGYPNEISLQSIAPYRFYSAKVVVAGIEVIPKGQGELQNFNNGVFNMLITSGNILFFDRIAFGIKDMGDSTSPATKYGLILPFKPFNKDAIWSVDSMADSQGKTDGWIFPIVDYGGIPDLPPYNNPGQLINVRNQRPAFFVHSFVETLATAAEYDIDYSRSSLMRDPLYQKLLIPQSNSSWERGSDYQNANDQSLGFATTLGVQRVLYPMGPASGNISFNPVSYPDGSSKFDGINYKAKQPVNGTVTLVFDCFMEGLKTTTKPSQVTIGINVRKPDNTNANISTSVISFDNNSVRVRGDGGSRIDQETFRNVKLSADVQLDVDYVININFSIQTSQQTYFIMRAGSSLQFLVDDTSVLFGQNFECERIIPDVGQTDLLKDVFQKFGTVCQCNDVKRTVTFASFTDIVNNIPRAVDWSDKLLNMGEQDTFQLQGYSQINWLRYQQDSTIPLARMPRFFADDKIVIDDRTLNPATPQQDLFTSIFAPSLNRPFIGGSIARLADPTSTDEFSAPGSPRILVDEKYILKSGESVTFADADYGYQTYTRTLNAGMTISIPYFYKPGGDYNLCYCDQGGQIGLRKKYFSAVESILKLTKKIVVIVLLTPYDIASLDLLIPVYLRRYNTYFYISKIDSWQKNYPCKVELVKLY